jgi:hypothetical protein
LLSPAHDGFLTTSEIATLKLDVDWIILSACNTTGALSGNAEATFFYARALLVALGGGRGRRR